MNDKKGSDKMSEFEVTGTVNRTVLDSLNNPVDGIVISFLTKKGVSGSIEMPMKNYTKEKALDLISKKSAQLEELLP